MQSGSRRRSAPVSITRFMWSTTSSVTVRSAQGLKKDTAELFIPSPI